MYLPFFSLSISISLMYIQPTNTYTKELANKIFLTYRNFDVNIKNTHNRRIMFFVSLGIIALNFERDDNIGITTKKCSE